MIQSKEELRFYLEEDRKANLGDSVTALEWIRMYLAKSQRLSAYRFLKSLRLYEYSLNTCNPDNLLSLVKRYYYNVRLNWASKKYKIDISANCIGYGCTIHHINAGGIVFSSCKVGNYLDIRQCTTIGVKSNDEIVTPVIGDNVFLGCNVSVIGGVTIGSNVVIGAGSVVVKDIPSNCIAAGNPCKVIKLLDNGKQDSNG